METLTTAELRKIFMDELVFNSGRNHKPNFESWKAEYCKQHNVIELKELKPVIAIVIEGGCISAIATAGQGITVRVIDLDNKKIGEPDIVKDYTPDVENMDMEQYTKEIMED